MKDEIKRGNAINETGWDISLKDDYDKALKLYDEALLIAEKELRSVTDKDAVLAAKNLESSCFGNMGVIYKEKGEYDKALEYYFKALKVGEETGNKKNNVGTLINIGVIYGTQGDAAKALEYYFKALKISEEINYKLVQAICLGNIGSVYHTQGDLLKALSYYFKAEKIDEEIGNKRSQARNLGNIGALYHNLNDLTKAKEYYSKALKINIETGNKKSQAANLANIAGVFTMQADSVKDTGASSTQYIPLYENALNNLVAADKIDEEIGNKGGRVNNLTNISAIYITLKKYDLGEKYTKLSYELAKELGSNIDLKNVHQIFTQLYEESGRSELALQHYKLFIQYRDSIFNEETTKAAVQQEMQFDFDKKEAASKLEQEKKEAVAATESKKQQIIIWSVCGILILVIGFAVFAIRSNLQKRKANNEILKQKEIIEEKQKEVLDSIHYAKRIQTALLPHEKYIHRTINKLSGKA